MTNNIRTLEIFNTLEAFKRKEYKLVKESLGLVAVTVGAVGVSSTVLPETAAIIPTIIVGVPAMTLAFRKALKADKISTHADGIFKENLNEIMDFKLNSINDVEEFTRNYPNLVKKYPNLLK